MNYHNKVFTKVKCSVLVNLRKNINCTKTFTYINVKICNWNSFHVAMFVRIRILAFSYTKICFAFGCNIWKEITMVQKHHYKHSFFQLFTNMHSFVSDITFEYTFWSTIWSMSTFGSKHISIWKTILNFKLLS